MYRGLHIKSITNSKEISMTSSDDSLVLPSILLCQFFHLSVFFSFLFQGESSNNKMVGSSSKTGTLQIEEFYRGLFLSFLIPFFRLGWHLPSPSFLSLPVFPSSFTSFLPSFLLPGKGLFVTGATGFVGKVLVEKILRSLPCVGKVSLSLSLFLQLPPPFC